jgi:precorrin-6B methylase 1
MKLDRPSLIVVGAGIRVIGQLTTESIAWIKVSEMVLYVVHDPVAAEIISDLNPSAESLARFYAEGKPRRQTYNEMVERVMECVCSGKHTCLVFYGHPGMFCWPGHEAVRQARLAGYTARMLPGISAEDCLFADLGLDPATSGCQSYEATDFLKNGRHVDPSSLLILWQPGLTGDPGFKRKGSDRPALPLLIQRLCRVYSPDHEVIVYVAPIRWAGEPVIQRMPLGQLAKARFSATSTLCIPPSQPTRPDVDIYKRLNLLLPEEGPGEDQTVSRRRVRSKRAPSGVPHARSGKSGK